MCTNGPCVKGLVSKMVELGSGGTFRGGEMEPTERSLDLWRHVSSEDCGTLAPFFFAS
jgi:hypothetical protein